MGCRVILNDLVETSQENKNAGDSFEGLKILARIIAVNILATGTSKERCEKLRTTTGEGGLTDGTKSNTNRKTAGKYPVTTHEEIGNKQYSKNPVTFTMKTGHQEQANARGKRQGKPQGKP